MIYLNTDHLHRSIQTLQSSLKMYQVAEPDSIDQDIFCNAIIKGYEISQETGFKLLRKALKEYGHSSKTLNETPIKEILRLAAVHGLMSVEQVERWFIYRDDRVHNVHNDLEDFEKKAIRLLPDFIVDISDLAQQLDTKLGKDSGHAKT